VNRHAIIKNVFPLVFCTGLFPAEVLFVATPFTDVNSFTGEIEGPRAIGQATSTPSVSPAKPTISDDDRHCAGLL
jgi:hypothetical protein